MRRRTFHLKDVTNIWKYAVTFLKKSCTAFLRSWSNSFIEHLLEKNFPEKLSYFCQTYSALCAAALKRYVFSRGAHLAELLTRSIFARDWLACNEPRSPRPIVKNVIDEIRNLNEKNTRNILYFLIYLDF